MTQSDRPDIDSMQAVVEAIHCGAEWGEIVTLCEKFLCRKSRMLFHGERDLFAGMTVEDVLGEVQDRFADKVRNIGFANCNDDQHREAKVRTFLSFSVLETKNAAVRRKQKRRRDEEREADRQNPSGADQPDTSGSFEKQMRAARLRQCIEQLKTEKQREMGRQLLQGARLSELSRQWNSSASAVQNMYERVKANLKACIESKSQEL